MFWRTDEVHILDSLQVNQRLEELLKKLQVRNSPHAAALENVPTQAPTQASAAVAAASQATRQAQVGSIRPLPPRQG